MFEIRDFLVQHFRQGMVLQIGPVVEDTSCEFPLYISMYKKPCRLHAVQSDMF
jgi:hypothetical protein